MKIADRMSSIEPFHVMDILARARQMEADGRDIVHMEVGEPDFATVQPIIDAGRQALAEGKTHYTPAIGLAALREAISNYYEHRYGHGVPAGQCVVAPGASGALQLALGVSVNPGDEVLIADPGYPCNRHMVTMLGGVAKPVPVTCATGFQLNASLVEQCWTDKTRVVMLASPSNPTGTLVEYEELKRINEFVEEKGGLVIVDEIYHGLVYGEQPPTALKAGANIIVINSFSKYFGMTGWRLGWLIAPGELIDPLDRLAQNIFLAAPTPAQYAAITALAEDTRPLLDERRDEFKRRRDFLLRELQQIGFVIECEPVGAFYLYANCSGFTDDSMQFSNDLLEKAGVAITPGADFGDNRPNEYVRLAYTTNMARLEEGVKRITTFVNQ